MTQTRGRTGIGPALRAFLCGVALVAALNACARPGDTPPGTPDEEVTFGASAEVRPPSSGIAVAVPGVAIGDPCDAAAPRPTVAPEPVRTAGPGEPLTAEQRARQVLQAQRSAIPTQGAVPAGEADRARECVIAVQMQLNLRRSAAGELSAEVVREALSAAGLRSADVTPSAFAARTGAVCVLGRITGDRAPMVIAPVPSSGVCAA